MNRLAAAGWSFRAFVFLMAGLVAACGGDENMVRNLSSITVTAPTTSVPDGAKLQMTATAVYSDGSSENVTTAVTWASTAPAKASITPGGLVTGIEQGETDITATLEGVQGQRRITVVAPVVTGVEVTPANVNVAKGLTQAMTATAKFSDDSTRDVTTDAGTLWSSAAPAIASVSSTGVVTAVANTGTVAIRASFSGFQGSALITATNATVVSAAISPAMPSIPKGAKQALKLTAVLSDGSPSDLTEDATWSSSNSAVATVDNTVGKRGEVTMLASTGETTITATAGTVVRTTKVVATAATISSVQITPDAPVIAKGLSQQLQATAAYTDGSTPLNVTALSTWSSSVPAIAAVSATGLVTTPGAIGTATITVTYTAAGIGTFTDTTVVTVTEASLQSIQIDPPAQTLPKGGYTQQFSATGVFSDNSTSDITANVLWEISSVTAATISNAAASKGLLTTTATAGSGNVTAKLGTVTSGPAAITVTNDTLDAISIDPAIQTLALGQSKQYSATGLFTGTTPQRDITQRVVWASSDETVATISNAAATRGFSVSQSAGGPINITASFAGKVGTSPLTVTSASLVAIEVSPATATLPKTYSQPFSATGTFSDGSVADVTTSVTWASTDSNVATISNAAGSRGVARGGAPGNTTIRAFSGSVEGSTDLTVTNATLTSIQVSPDLTTIPLGATQEFTATGTFSDGYEADLTDQVNWQSSDANIATISNAMGTRGVATAAAQGGPIAVTAAKGSVTGTASLNVSSATITSLTVRRGTSSCIAPIEPADTDLFLPLTYFSSFIACAEFTDGQVRNVTSQVLWSSEATTVATISNEPNLKGVVSAIGEGRTVVIASLGGKSDSSPIQVTTAVLTAIDVTPKNATITGSSGPLQFFAVGTFSDARTLPITSQVTWSSNSNTVAISNAPGTTGRATAGSGTLFGTNVTIRATRGSVSGQTTLRRDP